MRATEVGALPFEVVVGCPAQRIGPRITFAAPEHRLELAVAMGFGEHPWGPPDTVGLRLDDRGEVEIRAYHRMSRVPEEIDIPTALASDLHPIMAASGPEPEIYARWTGPPTWDALHEACARTLGLRLPIPRPRPIDGRGSLGISLRMRGSEGPTLTAFANQTALPPDPEIRRVWGLSLPGRERETYERALAMVRSLGPREGGSWHDFMAWGVDANGRSWRALSLRVPLGVAPA